MTRRPDTRTLTRPSSTPGETLALTLRDWMRATGRGPISPVWTAVWRAGYRAATLLGAALLRRSSPGVAVYLRGSFGSGRPRYGFSDLDFVAVTRDESEARSLEARVEETFNRAPVLRKALDVAVLNGAELSAGAAVPFYSRPSTTLRPSCAGVTASLGLSFYPRLRPWRRVAGPERFLRSEVAPEHRPLWAWLEVEFRWKHLLRAGELTDDPLQSNHVAARALVGLAQAFAWLVSGQEHVDDRDVARSVAAAVPDAADALARALRNGLIAQEAFPAAAAITRAIADRSEAAGGVPVQVELIGADTRPADPMPLLDWRSLIFPEDPFETLSVRRGSVGDGETLRRHSAREGSRRNGVLDGPLLALPIQPDSPGDDRDGVHWPLRAMHGAVSDPVCWALAQGRSHALFSQHPGWSAEAWTRIATDRLSAELSPDVFAAARPLKQLAILTAAARAQMLRESLGAGKPALPVSLEAVAAELDSRDAELACPAELLRGDRTDAAAVDLEPARRSLEATLRRPIV